MVSTEVRNRAHVVPFFLFLGILLLGDVLVIAGLYSDNFSQPWYRRRPEYLMMLLQLLVLFPLLYYWRKVFQWNVNRTWIWGAVAGVVGIALWILPSYIYTTFDLGSVEDIPVYYEWLGLADRSEGFDAKIFVDDPVYYWVAVVLRFVRAVILVSLVEEIFWRGFLMRYIIKPDGNFWKIPFGKFSWKSYFVTTTCFMLIHTPVDYLGAIAFGSIMYVVAVRTKSLFACIVMHALANFLMGVYAMCTGQYGLW